MEQKAWLWRRKPSEKTVSMNEKANFPCAEYEQEQEKALELERSLEHIKKQLSSAHTESNAKDVLLAEQVKVAEELTAGWEKAKTEAESLKKELANVLLQKEVAEDKLKSTDTALKESMEQLRVVKEKHQHAINDVATKTERVQEKARVLEKMLAETNEELGKLGVENSNLRRIIDVKEKLIEDLTESKSQTEASFTALLPRLDYSEKDNASLKYEVCMLQKELDIRNQDRDFHLKSADAAHKQYLASLKKIAKLESECQRLRVMVRRRLPGPAAIAKMRSEVKILGNSSVNTTQKKPTFGLDAMISRDFISGIDYDSSRKRVASLVERMHSVEDENKILKETLAKKNDELQSSRIMFARTASKLSQAETQLKEFSRGLIPFELERSGCPLNDLPVASISEDGGNEDAISCAESWASALISELEHFRNGKARTPSTATAGVSELSLMDDFIEMEKLAIVCVDRQSENLNTNSVESTSKEIVPVNYLSNLGGTNHEPQSVYKTFDNYPSWLQDILQVVVRKHHITEKSLNVILEEVNIALGLQNLSGKGNPSDVLSICSHPSQNVSHTTSDSLDGAHRSFMLQNETKKQPFMPDLENPMCKLIELIEGIMQRSLTDNASGQLLAGKEESTNALPNRSYSHTRHVAGVSLWEISDLCAVLQHFVVVCTNLVHGKTNFKEFIYEVASTVEWITKHSFSLKDVSAMEETTKKLVGGIELHGDNEFKIGTNGLNREISKAKEAEELSTRIVDSLPVPTLLNGQHAPPTDEAMYELKYENMRLRSEIREMNSRKKELEERLHASSAKNESMSTQLKESNERISELQAELMTLKYSNRLIKDQIENQKLITEDLGTQLTVANAKLNEAHQKFCSLEVELQDKNNCCEEVEATCLELQLQLESVTAKETPKYEKSPKEKQPRTDWEISAASEKLAECQATIVDLGKQLKALAAPKEAALFDKVLSPSSATRISRRSQLQEQMPAEDGAASEHLESPKTKEIICTEIKQPLSSMTSTSGDNPNAGLFYGRKLRANPGLVATSPTKNSVNQPSPLKLQDGFNMQKTETDVGRLVIVQKRQRGVSFLKNLLSRKEKESAKRKPVPIIS